jgi:rRNA maturation endonuclease Nob1
MEKTLIILKECISSYQVNENLFKDFDDKYYQDNKLNIEIKLKQLAIQLLSELKHVPTLTDHVDMQTVANNLNNDLNALNN